MKAQPLDDRLVIMKKEVAKTNSFGIIIPEDKTERTLEGEVLAIGTGKQLENGQIRPMTVKVGDNVLYPKGAGVEVKIDGTECLVLRETDILGILE